MRKVIIREIYSIMEERNHRRRASWKKTIKTKANDIKSWPASTRSSPTPSPARKFSEMTASSSSSSSSLRRSARSTSRGSCLVSGMTFSSAAAENRIISILTRHTSRVQRSRIRLFDLVLFIFHTPPTTSTTGIRY